MIMKHQHKQPVVSVENAPGEVIILPPVQVRRTTPPSRAGCVSSYSASSGASGLGLLLLPGSWRRSQQRHAAQHAGFGADPVCRSVLSDGPNDMGIGWNVLASLQRVAVGFGLAALAGIPLGFLIGRSLFLRPHV
jgi:nitrate/nitrite transport system permease protein